MNKLRPVAFIICVYHGDSAESFRNALTSIVSQEDVSPRVYLHIDGNVGLNITNVLSEFKDKLYKTIQSETSVGLAKGLNKLIEAVEDEDYIFRMDADDISCPGRCIKQIEFLEKNTHLDACGTGIEEFIGSEGNIVYTRAYPCSHEEIHRKIIKGSPFAHVTMCFRREFFMKFGLYPTAFPLNEDIAFWFQALRKGAVMGNVKEPLVKVRMDQSYGRRTISKAFPEMRVYFNIALWKKRPPYWAVFRFIFRLLPPSLVRLAYQSSMRNKILK